MPDLTDIDLERAKYEVFMEKIRDLHREVDELAELIITQNGMREQQANWRKTYGNCLNE